MSNAIRTGSAFALTVAIGYALCSLVFWLWPEGAVSFMNGLFHGLDFRKLQAGPTLFSFGAFFSALVVLALWAFVLGSVTGWIFGRLGDDPVSQPRKDVV